MIDPFCLKQVVVVANERLQWHSVGGNKQEVVSSKGVVVVVEKCSCLKQVRVIGVGRKSFILCFGQGKAVVGRKTLQLTLQVREGIVVGAYALCHSNHKLVGVG